MDGLPLRSCLGCEALFSRMAEEKRLHPCKAASRWECGTKVARWECGTWTVRRCRRGFKQLRPEELHLGCMVISEKLF